MTWEGRRLISTTKNGALIQYSYDDSGLRVSKQDSNGITRYTYDNGKIVHQYTENNNVITNELFFRYDENGAPLSVSYNGTEYFYVLNLQGDIIAIIDNSGAVVVQYTYDSWGKHSLDNISGSMATTLGVINPLRYRGYYYDTDTGFYYCISRYYDSETGRFINADGYISTGQGVLENNMVAYCLNNPVNRQDPNGDMATTAGALTLGAAIGGSNFWNPVGWIAIGVAVVAIAIWVIPWDDIGQSISNGWNQLRSIARAASISRAISKAVSKAKTKIRNENKDYDYWQASYVDYGNGKGVYIPTVPISYSLAIPYVRSGGNVFADSRGNAYKLAKAVGGGIPVRDPAHGEEGYWRHYHATRGGRRIGGHIFYVT